MNSLLSVLWWLLDCQCPTCLRPHFKLTLCEACSTFPIAPPLHFSNEEFSLYEFNETARKLLHDIKFEGKACRLVLLQPLLPQKCPVLNPQLVLIPVPLSTERFWKRGFNQSEWLAHALGRIWQLKVDTESFMKIQETPAQSTLNRQERSKNLRNVFQWQASKKPPDAVMVVDDVRTTGATLVACKEVLLHAGVGQVFTWTLFWKS